MDRNMLEKKSSLGIIANETSIQTTFNYSPKANTVVRNFPFFGKLQLVKDTKGILMMGFVLACWLYCTWSCIFIILIPTYSDGHVSIVFIIFYTFISTMTIISVLRTSTLDAGRISAIDSNLPVNSSDTRTKCHVCNKVRPRQAHHCSRCGQCVARMDHHCPWVNNCIGEENHYSFMLMVLYAFVFSMLSLILCVLYFFGYPECRHCNKDDFHIRHGAWFVYLLTAESAIFTATLFMLFINQHFNLLLDRTYIDTLTEPRPDPTKLRIRPMGAVYTRLCGTASVLSWFVPWRPRQEHCHAHTIV